MFSSAVDESNVLPTGEDSGASLLQFPGGDPVTDESASESLYQPTDDAF